MNQTLQTAVAISLILPDLYTLKLYVILSRVTVRMDPTGSSGANRLTLARVSGSQLFCIGVKLACSTAVSTFWGVAQRGGRILTRTGCFSSLFPLLHVLLLYYMCVTGVINGA